MQSPSKIPQPWDFDSNIYSDLLETQSKGDHPFYLAPGGQKDWNQVQSLYQQSPADGLVIAKIEVIYNKAMLKNFLSGLSMLEERGRNPAFQADWQVQGPGGAMRQRVHQVLLQRCSKTLRHFQYVKVVPMFHGTRQNLIASILKTNLANLTKVDKGFFGQGTYFTSYAKYAESYQRDRTLLFNWVSFFSAHPVHYEDDRPMWDYLQHHALSSGDTSALYNEAFAQSRHYGKANLPGYDGHYALVVSSNPTDPNEMKYYPIQDELKEPFDELVVFQASQILPRYVVTLGPTGLKLKSLIAPRTIGDLVQVLTAAEKYFGVPSNLRNLLQRLRESLQSTKASTLVTEEQNWLLAHISCLNFQCDQSFKQKAIHKLLGYFQEVELPTASRSPVAVFFSELFGKKVEEPNQENRDAKIISALQISYRQRDTIPSLLGGVTLIEQSYTDLVIVNREEKKVKKEEPDQEKAKSFQDKKEAYHDSRISSWEDIQAAKEPIALPKLFDQLDDSQEPKRLLLVGRAGMGKSTLCQYIAYSWASGELWSNKFEAIIWIPLRTLRNFRGNDMSSFILQHCIPPSEKRIFPADLTQFLQTKKEKVLFILDGYDEAQFSAGTPEARILQELMDYPRWLLTSRPYAVHGFKADRTLESVGFSETQVQAYLLKILPDDKVQQLKVQLQANKWLAGISHIPLNLELICHLWRSQQGTSFESMTMLYRKFTLELQRWFLQKSGRPEASVLEEGDFEKIDPQHAGVLHLLEEIAWVGLEEKNLLISFKDPKINPRYLARRPTDLSQRIPFNQLLKEIGFIQSTGSHSEFFEDSYYFAHLTFQEFFAARYICRLLKELPQQAEALIQSQKFNPQFQVVFWFVAGLLKEDSAKLCVYFDLLDTPKDLVGFYTFQLKMRCLEECSWSDHLTIKDQYLQEASYWCQWLFTPFFSNLVKDSLIELLRITPLLRHQLAPGLQQELAIGSKIGICTASLGLAQAGSEIAKVVVPQLLQALKDKNEYVRRAAATALGEAVKAAPACANEVVPQLQQALKDKDWNIRIAAATALREAIKAAPECAKEVVPLLLQVLKDKDWVVRKAAAKALGEAVQAAVEIAKAVVPQFLQALKDENSFIRVLGEVLKAKPEIAKAVVSQLLQALREEKTNRRAVANVLGEVVKPGNAKAVVSLLLQILTDKDSTVREAAARALGEAIKAAPEIAKAVVPQLLQALKDENRFVRRAAATALEEAVKVESEIAKAVVPQLLQALKDEDRYVREAAATALEKAMKAATPECAKEVIPQLLQVLEDKVMNVQSAAATALGEAVKAAPECAKEAVPQLLQVLKDKDWTVQSAAVTVLGKAVKAAPESVKEVVPQLLQALKYMDNDVRRAAATALGEAVKAAPECAKAVVPQLLQVLEDRDKFVRLAAATALREAMKAAPKCANEVVPLLLQALKQALKDEDRYVRWAATTALWKALKAAPECAKEVVPLLLQTLKDKDSNIRMAAAKALCEAVKAAREFAKEVVPLLLQALNDVGVFARRDVAIALVEAIKAVPECALQCLEDEDSDVRSAAVTALGEAVKARSECAKEVFLQLLQALKDWSKDVRMAAATALGTSVNAFPEISTKVVPFIISFMSEKRQIVFTEFFEYFLPAITLTQNMLLAMIKESDDSLRADMLWIIITKCIKENIPIFIVSNRLCFYKNGLQQIEVPASMKLEDYMRSSVRNYPQRILNGWGQTLENEELSDHAKGQITAFEKLLGQDLLLRDVKS